MGQCSQTDIPDLNLETDDCNGNRVDTNCITSTVGFEDLDVEANGTQAEINQALYTTFVALRADVEALTARVEALEP